nr:MAG TPA_asm: hypothetical protein [Caudoviricetes sp.]
MVQIQSLRPTQKPLKSLGFKGFERFSFSCF